VSALTDLQTLFRELFQLELADLDFGIYRLLRLKREEIEAFLTKQLPDHVEKAFQSFAGEERAALESEIAALTDRIHKEVSEDALLPTGEIDPQYQEIKVKAAQELLQHYQSAREKLKSVQASEAQMAEVFNHLYSFFARYYDSGDFIPRRRYGAIETYAVPYRGEEVFFHWANKDQHYVKTAEAFRDYAFTVETLSGSARVRFALTEVSVPPGNLKGDARYFFPISENATWSHDTRHFELPFHYRLPTEKELERYGKNSRFQESLVQEALPKILKRVPDVNVHAVLSAPVDQKDDQQISLLLKRLRHFCRRNTTDYFIHKDLQGFLTRELEFYIKDQVLHLGDLDGDLDAKRRVLRVLRQLAEEVITFLAQIENVQKRLFEKRKFVLRTDYLAPIKEVPHELWKEVLSNKQQVKAWKDLFAIEPKKGLFNKTGTVNDQFLKEHPTLVVNTFHFKPEFKDRLLASFSDLDEVTDGLLIHGENCQSLRLLQRKYTEKIKCIYIDPPYNTGNDEFIYKAKHVVNLHEYIWCYANSLQDAQPLRLKPDQKVIKKYYKFKDSKFEKRGPYRLQPLGTTSMDYRPNLRYPVSYKGQEIWPEQQWQWSKQRTEKAVKDDELVFVENGDGETTVNYKQYLKDEHGQIRPSMLYSIIDDIFTQHGTSEIRSLLGTLKAYTFPKPSQLVKVLCEACSDSNAVVLDFFAGSGTTGHALMSLNREDGGLRKFILVEMANYFDTVLLPRIQKVMYTADWKDGKPARMPTKDEAARIPRLVKVLRLEGYEDALHNLVTEKALHEEHLHAKAHKKLLGEDVYRLHYLARLSLESNATMLNVEALEHPFEYNLEVLTDSGPQIEVVDLVETFNLLYGLHVSRLETWVNGKDGRAYKVVKGKSANGESALIVWRDMKDLDPVVEREFLEPKLKSEGPFNEVLVNGDSATPGVKSLDGIFKRLLEAEER
jgi:adenine-specific DNA-methyltransferase